MPVKLKVLVCYHKPARLFRDEVYEPIHCGRACCSLPAEEKQWMLEHMRGDDTGENISALGLHFAETSAIYWAWKNYNQLGNPDYIGVCHYRRLFDPKDIASFANYDIMAPFEKNRHARSVREVFFQCHGTQDLEKAVSMLVQREPSCRDLAESYLRSGRGYYYNAFIMRREIFHEYCEKLFDLLFRVHEQMDYVRATYYNRRMPAFVAERLTGIYITEKENEKYRVKKCIHRRVEKSAKMEICPKFGEQGIAVCLSADDNYAPYLLVAVSSIKANRREGDQYEIYVLDGGVTDVHKRRLSSLCDENFYIRFIDISPYLEDVDPEIFQLNAQFSTATYYRFFIPEIFRRFSRLLYLDCDIVAHHNLAELYRTDIQDHVLAAVPDIEVHRALRGVSARGMRRYLTEKLNMMHPDDYFQAGVLLLHINKMREMDFTNKCLARLQEIGKPLFVDQCVMNSVLDGNYHPLALKWNVLWHLPYYEKFTENQLSAEKYAEYFEARGNPWIVHYSGEIKPWKNTEVELADLWWKYARATGYHESLLLHATKTMMKDISSLRFYRVKYYWYKLLSKVTFGKMRKHYKHLRNSCKVRINAIRDVLQTP